jgi:hypothetical protein
VVPSNYPQCSQHHGAYSKGPHDIRQVRLRIDTSGETRIQSWQCFSIAPCGVTMRRRHQEAKIGPTRTATYELANAGRRQRQEHYHSATTRSLLLNRGGKWHNSLHFKDNFPANTFRIARDTRVAMNTSNTKQALAILRDKIIFKSWRIQYILLPSAVD